MFIKHTQTQERAPEAAFAAILDRMLANEAFSIAAHCEKWVNHIALSTKNLEVDYLEPYKP